MTYKVVVTILTLVIFGAFLGGWLESFLTARTIAVKADSHHRTAIKVGDKFYYIVPESEYVEMKLDKLTLENYKKRLSLYEGPSCCSSCTGCGDKGVGTNESDTTKRV